MLMCRFINVLQGKVWDAIWGFVAEGLFQSEEEIAHSALFEGSTNTKPGDIKLKDINGDGKITWDQDMVPIGRSSIPEWYLD